MAIYKLLKEKSRSSLWLIPGIMGIGAIAIFAISLKFNIESYLTLNMTVDPESLSMTLGTLLAAIVTVFGILLPMTTSIIMRASSQYTPMVLRTYRSALPPKYFIGLVLFTIIYMILSLIYLNFWTESTGYFTIAILGFFLVFLSLFSIPPLFDYLVRSIEPSQLAHVIVEESKDRIKSLESSKKNDPVASLEASQDRTMLNRQMYQFEIVSVNDGYLQSIDFSKLVTLCAKDNIVIALPKRVGEFVLYGSAIIYIQSDRPLEKVTEDKLRKCFMIGKKRVQIDDLELFVEELVFITLKALSPGVNDLSTAIECLNSIGAVCNNVLEYRFERGVYADEEKQVRVYAKEFDFSGFIHCAFDKIRVEAKAHPALVLNMLNLILELMKNSHHKGRIEVFHDLANQVISASQENLIDHEKQKMNAIHSCIKEYAESCR
jgi:uncharacterized membrane protein